MNNPNTEINRFKIIVIQSLRPKDLKSGEHLFEDVVKWKGILKANVPSEFYKVGSKDEFIDKLSEIRSELVEGDILTLQLETHGADKGIEFSNGEMMGWSEFQDQMRLINEQIGGLLVVCLAMCFGGATISTIRPDLRAPYRAIVAPFKEVPAGSIEDGFHAFYDIYDNMLDLFKAMEELNKVAIDEDGKPYFHIMHSQTIFDQTFDPDRDPANTRRMAELICMQKTGGCKPEDIDAFELEIRALLQAVKITYRDHYLFKDLYKK